MIKYKIGFAISAETLFELLGKLLPIEDLEVEEIVDKAERLSVSAMAKAFHAPKLEHAKKPKKAARRRGQVNLTEGVNSVIAQALSTGPKRHSELRQAVIAAGYAGAGVGSRIDGLLRHKIITRAAPGVYEIADDQQVQTRRPQGGPVRESA